MSRTMTTIIYGGIAGLIVIILIIGAFLFGRSIFSLAESRTTFEPTHPAITEAPTTESVFPTSTPTAEPTSTTSTAEPTTEPTTEPTAEPTEASATPTAEIILVSTTPVEYIQALTDVNIRRGPGTQYGIISYIAEGQHARVTGVNDETGWWRVICPDDTVGSCWVTGGAQYTQPSTRPGPAPSPEPCSNIAALIADVTVPDNTQFDPNTPFNKTWRIKNNGTCTWTDNFKIVHAGGSLLGAGSAIFPLNKTVAPGQTVDITISMVSPSTAGTYQSDWKLQTPLGRPFGIGANGRPFFVKISVAHPAPTSTISGLVFQDGNENGIYDVGEPLLRGREVWLIPGTTCHVAQDQITAVAYTGPNGLYTFSGNYTGSYCVGVVGRDGLDDVRGIYLRPGQIMTGVDLVSGVGTGSISGYVWNDYCSYSDEFAEPVGNCVPDGSGGFRADGMIQPTEVKIPGITVLLKAGSCNNNAAPIGAVTDESGRYTFNNLVPGPYCVYINAPEPGNAEILLPGTWTFPHYNIWYQEIYLSPWDIAFPVNFGWDYQFD